MFDSWKKFDTWVHTQKVLLLIVAIVVFYPVFFFLFYPNLGFIRSIVLFFVYLIIVAIPIRIWGKRELDKEDT
jgi:hypothetical protein